MNIEGILSMILIYPPVSKGCEPPAGVALLAGALKQHNIPCTVIDANIEGLMWMARHGHLDHCHSDSAVALRGNNKINAEKSNLKLSRRVKNRAATDSWTRRALIHFERNLKELKTPGLYENIDRYRQRLMDVNRVIATATESRYKISLTDYTDAQLTPLRSHDLLYAAEHYTENPFYPYFESRLKAIILGDEEHSEPFFETASEGGNYGACGKSIEDHQDSKNVIKDKKERKESPGGSGGHDIIGISLCYLNQALTAFALAGWIKARFPEKRIVLGGGLVTSWMSNPGWNGHHDQSQSTTRCENRASHDSFYENGCSQIHPFGDLIDVMVKGRGEEALVELAAGKRLNDHVDAPGVTTNKRFDRSSMDNCFQTNAQGLPSKTNNESPSMGASFQIDSQPSKRKYEKARPNFDFCHWDNYLAPGRVLPFRAADGCYWRKCRFCPERAEKRPYHPEKNEDLINELNRLSKRHRLDYIHFIDDAVPPTFLKVLADAGGIPRWTGNEAKGRASKLIDVPSVNHDQNILTWYGFVRFTKELADLEFCKKLYASGCRMLKLGLESGDQKVLDHMEKGTRLELASQALRALHGAGIHTYVYLLFGTACEDEASAYKTLEFVSRHRETISFLNLAIFNLPRFSEDAEYLETDLFYGGDLSLYLNFKHPLGWDRKEIRRFLDKKFKKEPGIASILKHDPPFFTSNHAMFIVDAPGC